MTTNNKKGNASYKRLTKIQLQEEFIATRDLLEEREKELEAMQDKLKEKTKQIREMHRELGEIKRDKQRTPKDRAIQMEKLIAAEEQMLARNKDLEKKLKESNKKKQSLTRENQRLKQKIETVAKDLDGSSNSDFELTEDDSGGRTAFHIDIYKRQENNFHGKIIHVLSKNEETFEGVNGTAICEFISRHISAKPEDKFFAVYPITDAQVPMEVFEDVKFQQKERLVDPLQPLSAGQQFAVNALLKFPVVPDDENMDVDNTAYAIRVLAMDESEANVVASNTIADLLTSGVTHYESQIDMPGLDPGKYFLTLQAHAPFAKIEATKRVELNVEA